jgi:DNA mismatch repair ATPase MutS
MKAFLMYKDRDFDVEQQLPWNEDALVRDLGLVNILEAMADGDDSIFNVARVALLCSLTSGEEIRYRQSVLLDCISHEADVRQLYRIAVEAIEHERSGHWGWFTPRYPSSILHKALDTLQIFIASLRKLRCFADRHKETFGSDGFGKLMGSLRCELSDEYLSSIESYLETLRFRGGIEISARLEQGNRLGGYVLREANASKQCWLLRFFGPTPPFTYYLNPRDESGARYLSQLKDQGIALVANALAQSTDHILNSFQSLRVELAFYIGCLNLRTNLGKAGLPLCVPNAMASSDRAYAARGLYDISLVLSTSGKVAGNDVSANHKDLVMITGANQGGKSTFLRSVGIAQLMMQAGMFVPAASLVSAISMGIFTHYKREEDAEMEHGKFDEELSRMNDIVGHLRRHAMVLFNESFAATNDREGSEIAGQITKALVESGIRVFFVTHLFEFAHDMYEQKLSNSLFLRAERLPAGTRTFRLRKGEPLQTGYGKDLYEKVFAGEFASTSRDVFSL